MPGISAFPRERNPDSTLALLREGYSFIGKRCDRYGTDAFEARLMLQRVLCARGADAARMFYAEGRFTRRGAIPISALKLLQDKGSVATLDDAAHRHRKAMFMAMMTPDRIDAMCAMLAQDLRSAVARWAESREIVLFDALEEVFCRAVCRWAGVPLQEDEVERRTHELSAMISGAAAVGPRNWQALLLRRRCERWARRRIADARRGGAPDDGTALTLIAWHRDADGAPLSLEAAAVELLNVLRPTVAVARFATFEAVALHRYPQCRAQLQRDPDYPRLFVQEVRRFYPFFPFVGGRVLRPFEWRGVAFEKGTRVLLDLYGTNRDPSLWHDAETFEPDRFRNWNGSAYDFVPQGGGDHHRGHRCPGEWLTSALLETFVRTVVESVDYQVPGQDLSIDPAHVPALPASGFVIRNPCLR